MSGARLIFREFCQRFKENQRPVLNSHVLQIENLMNKLFLRWTETKYLEEKNKNISLFL